MRMLVPCLPGKRANRTGSRKKASISFLATGHHPATAEAPWLSVLTKRKRLRDPLLLVGEAYPPWPLERDTVVRPKENERCASGCCLAFRPHCRCFSGSLVGCICFLAHLPGSLSH